MVSNKLVSAWPKFKHFIYYWKILNEQFLTANELNENKLSPTPYCSLSLPVQTGHVRTAEAIYFTLRES